MLPASAREGVQLLHQLQNAGIVALILAVMLGAVALSPIVSHRVFRLPADEKRSAGALDAFKSIAGYAAIFISFSLVQAQGNLRTAEEAVKREASAFNNVDRVLLRFGDPAFAALHPALTAYGRTVIDKEWPLLARGERSPEATAAFAVLARGGYAIIPHDAGETAIFSEFVRLLNELSDLREARLGNTELGLPSLFWATNGALTLLLFFLAGLVTPAPDRTIQMRSLTAAIALLLSLVIILDLPFCGETSVSPQPIENILAYNKTRV